MGTQQRNQTIDLIRGFAILIVVLGHTISAFSGHENNLFYNIIFSIQMPLFMVVSGYVFGYSKPLTSVAAFTKRIGKRSLTLLLPWFCWTLIRWLLTGASGSPIAYFLHIFSHMDSGYWFLFSLWTIDLIVSAAFLIGNLITKQKGKISLWCIAGPIIVVLFMLLALVGNQVGMHWFSIKLSLYYLPFYCLGLFCFSFKEEWEKIPLWIKNLAGFVIGIVYLVLIMRYTIHLMDESLLSMAIRILISLCGCFLVFRLFNQFDEEKPVFQVFLLAGTHSLELYVIHYFFLQQIPCGELSLSTLTGVLVCIVNYVICLMGSSLVITMINKNKLARRILFYK